jgi:oligopeptide transport system substrate-binding protein
VGVIEFVILESDDEAYALWLDNQLDYSAIPPAELLTHRVNHARETTLVFDQTAQFIQFHDLHNAPFSDVHLRRAFAAAFDRAAYINGVLEGQGLPMKHLTPPIVSGAPPIDAVGVGYDLAFAREELAAAGYPGCQGMPQFTIYIPAVRYIEGLDDVLRSWEKNLDCPEGTISVTTNSESPRDAGLAGWLGDYPDAHNWVGTILGCERGFFGGRACSEVDDLIRQAGEEVDRDQRLELYAQIEEAFFGEDGEFPLIPVRWAANYFADHTWLERSQQMIGRETYYHWNLDMDAKLAATGR